MPLQPPGQPRSRTESWLGRDQHEPSITGEYVVFLVRCRWQGIVCGMLWSPAGQRLRTSHRWINQRAALFLGRNMPPRASELSPILIRELQRNGLLLGQAPSGASSEQAASNAQDASKRSAGPNGHAG